VTTIKMGLKRCPACRTVCDISKGETTCFACEAPLGEELLPDSTATPDLLDTARRDVRAASSSLSAFAGLGVFGVLYFLLQPGILLGYKVAMGLILGTGILAGAVTERRSAGPGKTGRIVRKGFAVFGLVFAAGCLLLFGLAILLFASCMLGVVKGID
jgi:hypothetical protein